MSDEIATPAASAAEPVVAAPALPPKPEPEAPAALADTVVASPMKALEEQAAHTEEISQHEPAPPVEESHAAPVADAPEPTIDSAVEDHTAAEPATELASTPADVADEPVASETSAEPAPKKKRAKSKAAEPELAAPAESEPAAATPAAAPLARNWYVVKVQSGREDTIKRDIERKVIIQGLEEFFGRIEIPFEEVVEKKKVKGKDKKTGETVYQEKNVTKKRKKFPGYLFAEVDFNDRILYLFRETSGVGDFVGATQHRAPNPMSEHEVQSMLTGVAVKGGPKAGKVKVKLDFEKGDKVKIRDGAFSGMEGEVKHISEAKDASETPKVKVEVTIFGRPVEVELDYWQVDKA